MKIEKDKLELEYTEFKPDADGLNHKTKSMIEIRFDNYFYRTSFHFDEYYYLSKALRNLANQIDSDFKK